MSFKLPSYSDSLFLLAHGSYSHGNVNIEGSPDVEEVSVDVSVSYRYDGALNNAEVCLLENPENESGIGIFVGSAIFILPSRRLVQLSPDDRLPGHGNGGTDGARCVLISWLNSLRRNMALLLSSNGSTHISRIFLMKLVTFMERSIFIRFH